MDGNAALILHDGPAYRVRHRPAGDGGRIVLVMEYWTPNPTKEGHFASEMFFARHGLGAIGIKPARNDWYQDDEIIDAIGAVRRAAGEARLIGYGASMGGYGVINFADRLGLASLMAVCPQYSIDPARAPYEQRWLREAAGITFRHDRIGEAPPIRAGAIVFDPATVDARHAADIRRRHPALDEIRPFFGGHEQGLMLQQAGVYGELVLSLMEERFDAGRFARDLRASRRRSVVCWLGVAAALRRRGAYDQGFAALAEARRLGHPDPWVLDAAEGEMHLAAGAPGRAAALIAPWRAERDELVRWQLWSWGIEHLATP